MTDFYNGNTRPSSDAYIFAPRLFGDYRYNDPDDRSVQQQVAQTVVWEENNQVRPRHLAWIYGLPSGQAAIYALLKGAQHWPEGRNVAAIRGIIEYYAPLDYPAQYEMSEWWIAPSDPSNDGTHTSRCSCSSCNECDCGDYDCDECYPDGHPDGCDCDSCEDTRRQEEEDEVNSMDDQDDNDSWQGRPDMPPSPEGRSRFGIEIEFNAPYGDSGEHLRNNITRNITQQGIACIGSSYGHAIQRYWKMTTDATVSGGECVSPILSGSDESIEEVREVLRLVKNGGGLTARNVGMHVHLDVTGFRGSQLKALAHNLRVGQDFLAAFVPEWRYDGSNPHGAKLLTEQNWESVQGWIGSVNVGDRGRTRDNRNESCPVTRYRAFNFNSLLTYGTVEIRLLGHTLNTIKVRTWIRVLQAIVVGSAARGRMNGDALEWLQGHGLETEHADHFRQVATSRDKADAILCVA